ncbi:DUF7535 family protein [Halosolutus gelatinilyticus]|uniref:DUF7535 family protein n=1 Tax=Halosolutus gelatinilyticus TaxID=2931975 RepID=UPI001FF641E8|nr:hypothetical protein [Halosolutus gelatinilyticus]
MSDKVSEWAGYTENLEMSVFGYIIAVPIVIILLPLLPILVLFWLVWRAVTSEEEIEPSYQTWREQSGRPPSGS